MAMLVIQGSRAPTRRGTDSFRFASSGKLRLFQTVKPGDFLGNRIIVVGFCLNRYESFTNDRIHREPGACQTAD